MSFPTIKVYNRAMIENFNDLTCVLLLIALLAYILYRVLKSLSYHRLAKHIRDEEAYYHDWQDKEL